MFSQCDAWHNVSGSHLERCPNSVQYRLTIKVYDEVYGVYRCHSCRDELVTKADSDGIEILDETSLPLYDLAIVKKT